MQFPTLNWKPRILKNMSITSSFLFTKNGYASVNIYYYIDATLQHALHIKKNAGDKRHASLITCNFNRTPMLVGTE